MMLHHVVVVFSSLSRMQMLYNKLPSIIFIHTVLCYLYESGISLSALMKFHIHENFPSNLQAWNTLRDYLCELCMVSRREKGGQ